MASQAEQVKDKVINIVRKDVDDIKSVADEGVRSGAYLYPLKGIAYFVSHHSLWKPLVKTFGPAIITAAVIYPSMFFLTYVPQAAVLTIFNGPLAVFTTVLLVLSEASTIFTLVVKNFFISEALLDTFDGVLISKGLSSTVSKGRELRSGPSDTGDPIGRLGKNITKPFAALSFTSLVRYLMYLPLNFIPVVGTVIFVILQGKKFGPASHARYFQLKQMSHSQQENFIEKRRGAYTSFGIVATLFEMIPVASLFFTYTNVVGAALWAARLEKGATTAPTLREQAEKAE